MDLSIGDSIEEIFAHLPFGDQLDELLIAGGEKSEIA